MAPKTNTGIGDLTIAGTIGTAMTVAKQLPQPCKARCLQFHQKKRVRGEGGYAAVGAVVLERLLPL